MLISKKILLKFEKFFLGLFMVFVTIMLVTTIFSIYNINNYAKTIQSLTESRLSTTAKLAASTITDYNELNSFQTLDDMESKEYKDLLDEMRKFANENGLVYVYFMREVSETQEQMIIDSDPEEPLLIDYIEDKDEYTTRAFQGETVCMKIGIYNSNWEGIIAAYSPIYDDTGKIVAIVGVDLYDVNLVNVSKQTLSYFWVTVIESILLITISAFIIFIFRIEANESKQASTSKSVFLSRMSHEIRTPMNAIIGFCRMAENSKNIEEIKHHLGYISDSSSFLLQLINNILDISKIEAGKMQLNIESQSPKEIMESIYNMLNNQAQSKNITFEMKLDEKIPNWIYCDKTYFTQVIVNLLSNALKFTDKGGKVTVSVLIPEVNEKSAHFKILVSDTGIGIKKENLVMIFEAFEQADSSTTKKYGGTGLGLHITKLLVELMGGTITATSELNVGSTFIIDVWFDIADSYQFINVLEQTNTEEVHNFLKGKNVLIAEDIEVNQMIAEDALSIFEVNIDFAFNGEEAVKKYLNNPTKYSLIIMDIQMPIMDGYEATRLIRSSNAINSTNIPIIAMSANVFKEDIDASLKVGMNGHVGKPFEIEELINAISKITKN